MPIMYRGHKIVSQVTTRDNSGAILFRFSMPDGEQWPDEFNSLDACKGVIDWHLDTPCTAYDML